MKGIVFNLLEEAVRQEYGEETWEELLKSSQLDGVYTSLGSYPDGDLFKIVTAASSALKVPAETVIQWFGRRALPLLAERYPQFFTSHQSTRPFLLTLNDIIHPEVRKIYHGADVPEFTFDTASDSVLVMEYKSARRLCPLAKGLIEGAAAYYHEEVTLEEPRCMNRGDACCTLKISFKKTGK